VGQRPEKLDLDQTQKLELLLQDLSDAVEKVAALKSQMGGSAKNPPEARPSYAELSAVKERLQRSELEKKSLEAELAKSKVEATAARDELVRSSARAEVMAEEARSKGDLCAQLTESVHRARSALNEEREKSERLDRKLEAEGRAAKKVAHDITKYVEQMRAMEREVAELRRERETWKKRERSQEVKAPAGMPEIQMAGDVLSVVTVEREAPAAPDKTELVAERAKRLELEIQAAKYRDQIADYEGQLAGLKLGLEGLQGELERCQNAGEKKTPRSAREAAAADSGLAMEKERVEGDLKRLKAKTRALLAQYDKKKTVIAAQAAKMKSVRGALLDLRTVCAASEENYRAILSHLGSEVEIAARLMSAYLDADIGGGMMKHSGPVTVRGRPTMLAWFEDVHAMSTWLQKQLVAFGKRLWTDREPIDRDRIFVPFPRIPAVATAASKEREEEINTLSEFSSVALLEDQDFDRSASIRAAVALQDQMVRSRDDAIQKMLLGL